MDLSSCIVIWNFSDYSRMVKDRGLKKGVKGSRGQVSREQTEG